MTATTSHDDNDPIVRFWTRLWIDRDEAGVAELLADPYVRHGADGSHTTGPADYARHVCRITRHLEGTSVVFDHVGHDGTTTHARFTLHGIDLGTGRRVAIACLGHYRIEDGHIAESWSLRQTDRSWPG